MAREIIQQLDGKINEFIMGVGTGGSFSGNTEILKKEIPGIRCIPTEPLNVRALSGGDISGKHRLEGIGSGFVPAITRLDLADEIIAVSDEDAYETARKLARMEGIFAGVTSGQCMGRPATSKGYRPGQKHRDHHNRFRIKVPERRFVQVLNASRNFTPH